MAKAKPELTRFKTYYSVPDVPSELDGQLTTLLASFATVRTGDVLERLAALMLAVIDRVERSIYEPRIACAAYRKACQLLSERDIDPWELAQGDAAAEAFHQDAYDGLPGVDEYEPFTSLTLIKLLARALIDRQEVINEMLSGVYHSFNRERVAVAGLLGDGRFVPYLEGALETWNSPEPPRQVLGALGQISTVDAVTVIKRRLSSDDEETVLSAIEALEQAGTTGALEALTELRATGSYPPELEVAIANITEGLNGLLRMARARDAKLRAGALERLGGLKDTRAVLALAEGLEDMTPVMTYPDGHHLTVADIACTALDYYGRAYLRGILPETLFDKFRTMIRKMRHNEEHGEWPT